jgi:hypothetical protein
VVVTAAAIGAEIAAETGVAVVIEGAVVIEVAAANAAGVVVAIVESEAKVAKVAEGAVVTGATAQRNPKTASRRRLRNP